MSTTALHLDLGQRLADACRPATPDQGLAVLMWLRARGLLDHYRLARVVDGEGQPADLNETIAEQARTIAELQRALSLSNHKPKEAIPMYPMQLTLTVPNSAVLAAIMALASGDQPGPAPAAEKPARAKKGDPAAGQAGQAAPAAAPDGPPPIDPQALYAQVAGKVQARMKAHTDAGRPEADAAAEIVGLFKEAANVTSLRALQGQPDMVTPLKAIEAKLDALAPVPTAAPAAAPAPVSLV